MTPSGVSASGIDAQDVAAETGEPRRDGASDRTHADDTDHRPVEPLAVEHRAPAVEAAGTHQRVAVAHPPRQRDREPDGKLGGRVGEQIGRDRYPDAGVGAGINVEVVEAFQRAGDHLQPRALLQERGVDAIRHEREQGVGVAGALDQLALRPRHGTAVGVDVADRPQTRDHLVVDPVADDDARCFRSHFSLSRSQEPRPSTTMTQARIVSRIAETWAYSIMRSAAISSKPMPPAPTMPSTADARK